MKINTNIFRAYDVRGIYPSEINTDIVYKIARAFGKFLSQRLKTKKLKIVVGRDNRSSSPNLFQALSQGLLNEGVDLIDIGLSASPLLYFAVAFFRFDGGVQITSSHNPPQYNGLKLVEKKAFPVGEGTGLKEIKKIVLKGKFEKNKTGKIQKKKIINDYVKFNLKNFNLEKFAPFKIVVDTANSVSGILIPRIFEKTKIKIFHLFAKLDGSFPNHLPDPLIKENLKELRKQVLIKKADLGIAFDGDGDRIIFVDEKGKMISGDLITALISKIILRDNPNEKILYDIRSSNIVRETIEAEGGLPIVSRIGHSLIKEKMEKENILFAGEFSGHYYQKSHYFCEAPFFVIFKILEEISKTKKKISQLVRPFKKYFHSGEINFKVKPKKEILVRLEKKYKKGKISHLDGLRIDFKNWWFLVRPSQTEPLLRMVLEAKTKKLLEKKKKELIGLITPIC